MGDQEYSGCDPQQYAESDAAENKALGLNERGQVVGAYLDNGAAPRPDGLYAPRTVHGYLWERGRYSRLDVPGSRATAAWNIDNKGRVVGEFKDADGRIRGFLRTDEKYAALDGPDKSNNSIAIDITERGDILLQSPRMSGVVDIAA